jgi:hypothetical protein
MHERAAARRPPLSILVPAVADILQRLVKQDGGLLHPLVDGLPPLVLQYADDTLIILRAVPGAAERLKKILDDFANATGLIINFSKSTLVPMTVDAETLASATAVLGCSVEGFPQTYLGLPLSCEKLTWTPSPRSLPKPTNTCRGGEHFSFRRPVVSSSSTPSSTPCPPTRWLR